jgi:nicotinamide mononucleotide transporter
MQTLLEFFSVNKIAFTVIGYPMSYVELLGTIFNLLSVWLIAKNRILTWPTGIVGVLLFLTLFYQIRLYSDAFEQVYYLIACIYGWWRWSVAARREDRPLPIRFSPLSTTLWCVAVSLAISLGAGWVVSHLHLWSPSLFPEAAAYPYMDAATTIMSFTAMILMAQRRTESWIYWVAIDLVGVWLYYVKDVKLVSLLFLIYLGLAVNGLLSWRRLERLEAKVAAESKA